MSNDLQSKVVLLCLPKTNWTNTPDSFLSTNSNMPAMKIPDVDHFIPVQPSKEKIDFVSLHTIDLVTYDDGLEAQKQLAEQVRRAMTTQGFFTLINHGIAEEEISRQVDIGHTILKRTSQEEKEQLRAPIREDGNYFGFKPRGIWRTIGQAVDKIEQFNIYRDMSLRDQPKALEPFASEVQDFVDRTHKGILFKVLRLFAIALELDDLDFFVNLHDYEKHDLSWLRWMEYYDEHNEADPEERTLWLQGHQDLTCTTILFSQPMSTLQVRDYYDSSEWSK
jgi:isopenicillin N synthase-like dioxygenase